MGFGGDLDEDCAGRGFVDHDWIAFGQCEGRSGCYARAAASELVVCVVAFWSTCVVWAAGRLVCAVFWPCFPHKQGIVQVVWFLGPVFLINWINSILSIRAVDIDHIKLKKK